MLQEGFVQTLLDRKIINQNTIITAKFKKIDFSLRGLEIESTFHIDEVIKNDLGKFIFRLIRQENNERIAVPVENILLIDDNTPERLAEAFDIKIDGDKKNMGKRRGRPLKIRTPIINSDISEKELECVKA